MGVFLDQTSAKLLEEEDIFGTLTRGLLLSRGHLDKRNHASLSTLHFVFYVRCLLLVIGNYTAVLKEVVTTTTKNRTAQHSKHCHCNYLLFFYVKYDITY